MLVKLKATVHLSSGRILDFMRVDKEVEDRGELSYAIMWNYPSEEERAYHNTHGGSIQELRERDIKYREWAAIEPVHRELYKLREFLDIMLGVSDFVLYEEIQELAYDLGLIEEEWVHPVYRALSDKEE